MADNVRASKDILTSKKASRKSKLYFSAIERAQVVRFIERKIWAEIRKKSFFQPI